MSIPLNKRICIIVAPALGKPVSMMLPYGALYLESYLQKYGYQINIIDVDMYRYSDEEVINLVKSDDPFMIGISGIITPAYGYAIKISAFLKQNFPLKKIVLGGNSASAAGVMLKNSDIDYVVHGEGEITFYELCEKVINNETDFSSVKGISYVDSNGRYVKTPEREPVKDLGILDYPKLGLLDLDRYLLPVKNFKHYFYHDKRVHDYLRKNPHANRRVLGISFSRGCTHSCTFCYRHMKGYRRFPADYAADWLEKLIREHDFVFFNFIDENFNIDHKWVYSFVEEIKKRKIKIFFSIVYAVVKNVNEALLTALKEIGCTAIYYGLESGSNRMLSIMDKCTTVDENVEAVRLTIKAGLKTAPQLVIGMPGETHETIRETVDFLKKVRFPTQELSVRYALALPGTPLYEYDLLTKRIPDEHLYLTMISNRKNPDYASSFSLNHTDMPDDQLSYLRQFIYEQVLGKRRAMKIKIKEIMSAPIRKKNAYPHGKDRRNKQYPAFRSEYYKLGSLRNVNDIIKKTIAFSVNENRRHT